MDKGMFIAQYCLFNPVTESSGNINTDRTLANAVKLAELLEKESLLITE